MTAQEVMVESRETELRPVPPFDFDLTAGSHTYFRGTYGADMLEGGDYRRLLNIDGRLLLAHVRSTGTTSEPALTVAVQGQQVSESDLKTVGDIMAWNLGIDADMQSFYKSVEEDPILERITSPLHGLHPTRAVSVFEALVLAITGQQIAAAVARIVRTLLIKTYGDSIEVDGKTYHSFPTPAALLDAGIDGLRKMKLSQRKAEYVLGIAQELEDGTLDLEALKHASDDEVVERVTRLRGVGHWTAHWLLIRALSRTDAFPSGDLALKRVVSQLYFEGQTLSDRDVEEFSVRWSPYRSYAIVYMFAAGRQGLIAPANTQRPRG
jgi:DNA-3-methyladenine glycosylase II